VNAENQAENAGTRPEPGAPQSEGWGTCAALAFLVIVMGIALGLLAAWLDGGLR
jgi:hypothetical protein